MRFALSVLLATVWSFSYRIAVGEDAPAASAEVDKPTPCVTLRQATCPSGQCWIAETRSFRVEWCTAAENVRGLAAACEQMTAVAQAAWLGQGPARTWTPKCEILVHREVGDYVAYLGPGSEQTSGCATIRLDQGHVVMRRIDLREDALDWRTESLPHELMHVVLADRFSNRRIPPWADEGIAMLSETSQKRERRLTELRRVTGGMTYAVHDLMDVRTSPEPALRNAFYGQSVALTSLLLEWGSRKELLDFVEASLDVAPETALANVYGNRALAELEQQLTASIWSTRTAQPVSHAAPSAVVPLQTATAMK